MRNCERSFDLGWISGGLFYLFTFSLSRASERGLLGRDDTADGADGAVVESDMIGGTGRKRSISIAALQQVVL